MIIPAVQPKVLRLYLAGPMTGIEDFNYPAFHAAAAKARAENYDVCNPAELFPVVQHAKSWDWYMRRALALLLTCDSVLMLEGWAYSKGAKLERKIAHELGMTVTYQRDL